MKILTRLRKYQADLKLRWVHMPEGTFSDVDVFFFPRTVCYLVQKINLYQKSGLLNIASRI